jgi:hypothetical protein
VIILFTGVIVPDYLIPKVISDYLNIAFREKLLIIHSSKEITAFDCFLSATVKIQQGNFKKLLNSFLRPFSFILNPKAELMDETAIDDYSSVRICLNLPL